MGGGAANTVQASFRWRNDDGSESAATWWATLNNNPTPVAGDYDTNKRLRIMLDNTGTKDETDGYNWEYRIGGGAGTWTSITTTSSFVKAVESLNTSWTISDGDTTTQQIGSGTHDEGYMDTGGVVASFTLTQGQESENELVFQFVGADFSGGEQVEIRMVFDNGNGLDGYTNTPTISSMPTPPTGLLDQVNFRWRPEGCEEAVNDNGAGDWDAAINTNVTQDMLAIHGGIATSLRVEIEEYNSVSRTFTPVLQYKEGVGGTWTTPRAWDYVDPASETGNFDPVMIINKETTTDGAATTNILSGSAKGFVGGSVNHDATAANVTLNNQHTEIEWRILISRFAEAKDIITDGTVFYFRVTDSGTPLDQETQATITCTVNIPTGYIGGTGVESFGDRSYVALADGTLYTLIEDYELDANVMMLKSTDDGDTWTPVDASTNLAQNDLESMSMVYDSTNDLIHVLHVGGTAEYYQFGTKDHTTSADQWIVNSHQLNASIDSLNQTSSLVMRGSTLYAFYADLSTTDQIFYRKKTDLTSTNNWGSETSIDTTGGTTDFSGCMAVLGPNSNLIHIFYTDYSNLNVYHVSLNTSDTLGTRHTVSTDLADIGSGLPHGLTNAICWYNGSNEKAMIGFQTAATEYLYTVIVQDDGTPDSAQIVSNSVAVSANEQAVNSRQPNATLALDGTTAWALYVDQATLDLWRASRTDAGSWSGHTELADGITCHNIRGSVHTDSGSATILGYIWDTTYNQSGVTPKSGYAGTNRYDFYQIAAGGNFVSLSGTLTPAGAVVKLPKKSLAGSLTSFGTVAKKSWESFAGAITPTGIVSLRKQFTKLLEGAITPTGNVIKFMKKNLVGDITPTGIVTTIRTRFLSLAGAVTPAGAVAKKSFQSLAGTLTPTGIVNAIKLGVLYTRSFAGTITPSGTVVKKSAKTFVGAITPAGSVAKKMFESLAGTVTSSGTVTTSRRYFRSLAGTITPSGIVNAIKLGVLYTRSFAGSITPTGTVVKKPLKSLAGSVTATGEIVKKPIKNLVGAVTPAGTVAKKAFKSLVGSVTPSGALSVTKAFFISLAGTITPSGDVRRKTSKVLSGLLEPAGTAQKKAFKSLSGSITATGIIVKKIKLSLSGIIAATGTVASILNPLQFSRSVSLTLRDRGFATTLPTRQFATRLKKRVFDLVFPNRDITGE